MEEKCPIETTLALINGKWRILIMRELCKGPVRYGTLERNIPTISAKVLTQQLRDMEKDGLIIRTIYPEIPPHVEYSLDCKGVRLHEVMTALAKWSTGEDPETAKKACHGCIQCQLTDYYNNEWYNERLKSCPKNSQQKVG